MRTLIYTIFSVLSLQHAMAAGAGMEPIAAFTPAYEQSVRALLSHLQISHSDLGPKVNVDRKKNQAGQFADFVTEFDIDRLNSPVRRCSVRVFIASTSYLPAGNGDVILESASDGSSQVFARVDKPICQ